MDYKETVEWLKSYKDMYYRLEFINNKMEGVKAISYTEEAPGTAVPKSINDYIQEKEEIECEMAKIKTAINSLENIRLRNILNYKFIEFMNIRQIARTMHYSGKYIYELYNQGILQIMKHPEKTEKICAIIVS